MKCAKCGHEQDSGRYCQECGTELPVEPKTVEFDAVLYEDRASEEWAECYDGTHGEYVDMTDDQWDGFAEWAQHIGVKVRVRVNPEGQVTVLKLVEAR